MKIKAFLLTAIMALVGIQSFGQVPTGQTMNPNVITTAVPFVSIAPDARGGSMGDCGVASEADVYSMHYNPAKYTFLEEDMSIGLGYSPWLRNLVPDMNLAYLAFATKLTPKSALAATLRYFSCGEITFVDNNNQNPMTYKPYEMAFDATYSRMLTEYLSGAVAGRFILSNLVGNYTDGSTAGWSVAADVAVYYKRPVEWFSDKAADFSWGVNINNIGSKLSYSNQSIEKDFIPTTLRFGTGLKVELDEYNTLGFMVDVTKLLVPTPPVYSGDTMFGMDPNVPVVVGMIQSFYDAPGVSVDNYGVKTDVGAFYEELCEYNYGLGAEYWYNKVFALRAGYFHEASMKGNRKYITLGAALKYSSLGLDISYLIPVNGNKVGTNPLENTLRFNLTYDIISKK